MCIRDRDCCDFAIVYLSKEWRQTQSGRLEAVKPFKDDIIFQSLNFYDISVVFYQPDEDGILGSEDLPEDNNWCFVEPVSYTHIDVYKRQGTACPFRICRRKCVFLWRMPRIRAFH